MDVLIADLRQALRMIRRRPGFAATAVLTLAIGLGVNAVAFSTVNALLFRPRAGFDVEGAGRVMASGGRSGEDGISIEEYERLAAGTAGSLRTAVQGRTALAWHAQGRAETVWAQLVSQDFFAILETAPLVGRLISRVDDPAAPVAVVSERFWRERLDAADLRSLRVTLNGVDTPVIGVLPDSFEGPGGLYAPDLWLPFESRGTLQLAPRLERPDVQWLGMIGRLIGDTSIAQVDARLHAAAASLALERPETHARFTARFTLMHERVPEMQTLAWIAAAGMTAVGLVLLIACFNVANLLLARAVDRQRETAVRAAIGASRSRIVRQHVTEGLVLSLLAGGPAALVAAWSQQLVGVFAIPIPEPQRVHLTLDFRVLGFLTLMAIAAGILPALIPAIQSARLDLVRALSANGHGWRGGRWSGVRQSLMLVQIAGSTAFLAVAGLFVQSFVWSAQADPGFETEREIVMTLEPSSQGYDPDRARLTVDRLLDQLATQPGVAQAAVATALPFSVGFPRLTEVSETADACAAGGCPRVDTYGIGAGYFATMNIAMVRGVEFDGRSAADGAIVNEDFARRWFPDVDPIGRTIRLGASGERRVIVGVSRNAAQRGFGERARPALFLPLTNTDYEGTISIVVRTSGPPAPLVRRVADTLRDVDSRLAPASLMTMEERLQLPRWPMRAGSVFFGSCGVLALLLATSGLAAVMAHAVSRRQREFGIRLAVGATSRQLLGDVLVSAFRLVGPGILAGLVVAALFARAVRIALVGVDIASPWTYAAIALLQTSIALLACLAPARRAARFDPLTALRAD